MTDRIAVGDLVQVVKPNPCCGWSKYLGKTFVVLKRGKTSESRCGNCHALDGDGQYAAGERGFFALHILKRIPPLGELESQLASESLRAICPVPAFPTIKEPA